MTSRSTPFLCERLLLLQYICIEAGQLSENALYSLFAVLNNFICQVLSKVMAKCLIDYYDLQFLISNQGDQSLLHRLPQPLESPFQYNQLATLLLHSLKHLCLSVKRDSPFAGKNYQL